MSETWFVSPKIKNGTLQILTTNGWDCYRQELQRLREVRHSALVSGEEIRLCCQKADNHDDTTLEIQQILQKWNGDPVTLLAPLFKGMAAGLTRENSPLII